jgi:hypothetical protein
MVVTTWLIVIDCEERGLKEECILSLGDNTSAVGWLFLSSRLAPDSPYYAPVQMIARKLARLVTNSSQGLCAQHLRGKNNTVSDLLSFTTQTQDGRRHPLAHDSPSDDTLTQRFHAFLPQLIPDSFAISPLPNEIPVLSFVMLVMRTAESSLIWHERRLTKRKTVPGDGGEDSATRLASITPSSLTCPSKNRKSSCTPFSPSTDSLSGASQDDFLAAVRNPWRLRLSAMAQAIWLRRFGTISNAASRTAPSSAPPSERSSKHSKTSMTHPNVKGPSHLASSAP